MMRASIVARWLFAGLLWMTLQAGICADATAAAQQASRVTIAQQAQQLLPSTLALLQGLEQTAMQHGRALTSAEMHTARQLGVAQPERVRVLVSPLLPSWLAPAQMQGVTGSSHVQSDALAQSRYGIAAITAGHGIILNLRQINNPRILAHELVHVTQYEHLGMRAFVLRYLTELLTYGYYDAPLERAADAGMRRVMP